MAKKILVLNSAKASPINSVPSKILKENVDIFGLKLHIDFNSSISNGVFPNKQKYADITPVYKSNDKNHKENYRPVSILPAISKVFEMLLYDQIDNYMDSKLSIFQCGFRKKMGAQNCLLF